MPDVNAQLLGTGLEDEARQWAFLDSAFAGARERAVALWIHKPLFLDAPELDIEPVYRYLPREGRLRLCAMLDAPRPPRSSVSLIVFTPIAPRFVSRYWSIGVRLP